MYIYITHICCIYIFMYMYIYNIYNFTWNCRVFLICRRNLTPSTETLTERNLALHFTSYLSIALFKTLSHSKTRKNAKKLSAFGENNSRCLPNFLQTHVFWNFDHISRTYNQINYRNIWLTKVIITLTMTAQMLFVDVFSEKDPHLNVVEFLSYCSKGRTVVLKVIEICSMSWWQPRHEFTQEKHEL